MSCNLVNDAFYLNYDKGTQKGITVTEKNINCKNGVIHVVDGLLEEVVPKATTVKWDLTDYEELGAICEKFQLANLSGLTFTIIWDLTILHVMHTPLPILTIIWPIRMR